MKKTSYLHWECCVCIILCLNQTTTVTITSRNSFVKASLKIRSPNWVNCSKNESNKKSWWSPKTGPCHQYNHPLHFSWSEGEPTWNNSKLQQDPIMIAFSVKDHLRPFCSKLLWGCCQKTKKKEFLLMNWRLRAENWWKLSRQISPWITLIKTLRSPTFTRPIRYLHRSSQSIQASSSRLIIARLKCSWERSHLPTQITTQTQHTLFFKNLNLSQWSPNWNQKRPQIRKNLLWKASLNKTHLFYEQQQNMTISKTSSAKWTI